jgi:hypothetical protein
MTTKLPSELKVRPDLWDRLSDMAKEQGVDLEKPLVIVREPLPPMSYPYRLPNK